MATVLDSSSNKVKLDNGSIVTANTGGWYDGQQYWGGTLSSKGFINSLSNQQGAGQAVSAEVNAASAKAQGVSVQDFNDYLRNISVSNIQSSVTVPYTTNANSTYVTGLNEEVNKARLALDQNLATQRTQTQSQLTEAKAKETTALGEVEKLTTPYREKIETTKNAELGTSEVLASQKSLLGELDQLLTEGNALIKLQQEITGLASIRNPRIQKTMDDISARAGVINAVVSLQNTYLANAYNSIDRSINAITQDRQDRLNYYSTILNLANRDIVSLTSQDRELANSQTKLLESDLSKAQTTSNYIKQLMVNPDTALVMAQSGVTLNDSVEVINQKMAQYQYVQEVKEESNKYTSAGGVLVTDPTGIPASQLKSFTDSQGKTYYYKMPVSGSGSSVVSADDYFKKLTGESTVSTNNTSTVTNKTTNTSNEQPPQFSPSGGVGSIYVSLSGTIWQYTNSGWRKIS